MKSVPTIEEQWEIFQRENPVDQVPDITDEELKEALIKDLSYVCTMTVAEYTLYQKWMEVQMKFPTEQIDSLFGSTVQLCNPEQGRLIQEVKDNIWKPESIDDYQNLQPVLQYTDDSGKNFTTDLFGNRIEGKRDKDLPVKWNILRTFTSTMKNNSNIGRNMNFFVIDKPTGKYLGVICISSDFLDLTPRDKWIGWEREKKTQGNMINYTAIGSTIVPVQPLGYNYVGGKLLALLCLSDEVQTLWKELYGDVLVGVTTTSLYGKAKTGGLSQYDRLKHWKKMGYSSGTVAFESTRETQYKIRHWLEKHWNKHYFEWYAAKKPCGKPFKRDHRNRSYHHTYKKLKIDKHLISCAHQRGIYFAALYDNTREFLRSEIDESALVKSFDTSYEYLTDLWKTKYAKKRVDNLVKNDRVSHETLFYDDLIYMSWEETKEAYLGEVGR